MLWYPHLFDWKPENKKIQWCIHWFYVLMNLFREFWILRPFYEFWHLVIVVSAIFYLSMLSRILCQHIQWDWWNLFHLKFKKTVEKIIETIWSNFSKMFLLKLTGMKTKFYDRKIIPKFNFEIDAVDFTIFAMFFVCDAIIHRFCVGTGINKIGTDYRYTPLG